MIIPKYDLKKLSVKQLKGLRRWINKELETRKGECNGKKEV